MTTILMMKIAKTQEVVHRALVETAAPTGLLARVDKVARVAQAPGLAQIQVVAQVAVVVGMEIQAVAAGVQVEVRHQVAAAPIQVVAVATMNLKRKRIKF
jgi:hypothetical protein